MEDETALSIIDPVTLNMEVMRHPNGITTRGIPDAIISPSDRVLEVSDFVTCLSSFVELNLNLCFSFTLLCYSWCLLS
jgi:hypothetical protein